MKIETNIPEINVDEIMQQIREEIKKSNFQGKELATRNNCPKEEKRLH